jgi:integrase/recombinase XerD
MQIVVLNTTWQNAIDNYLDYLCSTGYSGESIRTKKGSCMALVRWLHLQSTATPQDTTTAHLEAYYGLLRERDIKPTTAQQHIRNAAQFFGYLQESGGISHNPASALILKRVPALQRTQVFTTEEIKKLYHHAQNRQERALLALSYGCGLRLKEISDANLTDFKEKDKLFIVAKGKNGKRRVVPMNDTVVRDIAGYIAYERPTTHSVALMINNHNNTQRMHPATIRGKIRAIYKRAGIYHPGHCVHTLRHSIATHLLGQGLPVGQVRIFLGHKKLESTQIYTHIADLQTQSL